MGAEMRDGAELSTVQARDRLPHYLSDDVLDATYPRVHAPPDVETTEYEMSGEDTVLNYGLKIADRIMQAAGKQGRLRHLNVETETGCI